MSPVYQYVYEYVHNKTRVVKERDALSFYRYLPLLLQSLQTVPAPSSYFVSSSSYSNSKVYSSILRLKSYFQKRFNTYLKMVRDYF